MALFFGSLFVLLVLSCLAAPLWAKHVAHTGVNENHLSDTIKVDGKTKNVVGLERRPDRPDLAGRVLPRRGQQRPRRHGEAALWRPQLAHDRRLGSADDGSAVDRPGLLAGFFGGWFDAAIRSLLDILWSFPVVILGVALGVALALGGIKLGPITISGDSLAVPIFIIGLVYIPYMARPLRGQVLSLREKEFVEASRAQGAGPLRIMFSEVVPNLASTILVFFTLLIANAILLEAALSFLGAGVRPPNPSWGTMIDEGVERIATAPHLAIVPGLMLVLTVLSLNVFGDGVRDALDPRSKVRLEH